MVVASALFLLAFLFGPAAIRAGYSLTTHKTEIDSLSYRYRTLDATDYRLPATEQSASARRRFEIAGWLAMRGIEIDPGIRDESVEHASFLIALYGTTRWAWTDIFRYWLQPPRQRTLEFLLHSDDRDA